MTTTSYARLIQAHFKAAAQDGTIDGPEMARALRLVKDAAGTRQEKAARTALAEGIETHRATLDPRAAAEADRYLGAGSLPGGPVDALVRDTMGQAIYQRTGGGLTGREIADAEAQIRRENGPEYDADVTRALRASLFAHADTLTPDGARHVQQTHGTMNGNIDRYQQIVEKHVPGGVLVDADFDGQLSVHDKVIVEEGGKPRALELAKADVDRLTLDAAVVGAAHDMAQAKHKFAGIEEAKFSGKFFEPNGTPGTFELKPGVSPSEAVQDIFANPKDYEFECATAIVVTYYKATLDALGPEAFDRIAKDLTIGPWRMEGDLRSNLREQGSAGARAQPGFEETLRPGDYTYFKNWDVSYQGRVAGWQGENVIYLGDGKYYGHPFGVTTEAEIRTMMDLYRVDGSQTPPGLTNLKRQLDTELLRHRTRP